MRQVEPGVQPEGHHRGRRVHQRGAADHAEYGVVSVGAQWVDAARASLAPVTYAGRPLFNTREGQAAYAVPAIMVIVMQQTMIMAIGLLMAGAGGVAPFGEEMWVPSPSTISACTPFGG